MATKADRYTIFLLCAVLVASARPSAGLGPALDLGKQQQLDDALAKRFPELDRSGRRALIGRALHGMPPIDGGLAFLALIEKTCARLKAQLSSPGEAAGVLKAMLSIARAGGGVTPPERLVLQATLAHLGLRGRAELVEQDGRMSLRRCA